MNKLEAKFGTIFRYYLQRDNPICSSYLSRRSLVILNYKLSNDNDKVLEFEPILLLICQKILDPMLTKKLDISITQRLTSILSTFS